MLVNTGRCYVGGLDVVVVVRLLCWYCHFRSCIDAEALQKCICDIISVYVEETGRLKVLAC